MKDLLDFKTLVELVEHFHDEETCRQYFTSIRFRDGEYCPHCGHTHIYSFSGGKRYRCASCKQDFTIKTGTVFGESKLPLRKWFIAIYLLSATSKGISSVQLAKHVGVTQKTGWFMDHRLRSAMSQNKGQLFGPVELDETYIGGLAENMHAKKKKQAKECGMGSGGKGKSVVFGMRSRTGEVKAQVVAGNDWATLHPIIKKEVIAGSEIYTDEHRAYNGLRDFRRSVVNHGKRIYVNGDCHTNGIESFWALFKRTYHGVYHWMSHKHMQRYVDEVAFRLNRKDRVMSAVFTEMVQKVTSGQHLPYKQLIA